MPNGDVYPSMLVPQHGTDKVVLYHGTPREYEGPPTEGSKDVLRTGYPSMTANPEIAEEFAGGSRFSRIYSTEIPKDRVLDMVDETDRWVRRGNTGPIRKKITDVAKDDKYDAVAISDITYGSDEPEYRLLRGPDPDEWQVGPTVESIEEYNEMNDVIIRLRAGEPVAQDERQRARHLLESDIQHTLSDEEMDILVEDGTMPASRRDIDQARKRDDKDLIITLAEGEDSPSSPIDHEKYFDLNEMSAQRLMRASLALQHERGPEVDAMRARGRDHNLERIRLWDANLEYDEYKELTDGLWERIDDLSEDAESYRADKLREKRSVPDRMENLRQSVAQAPTATPSALVDLPSSYWESPRERTSDARAYPSPRESRALAREPGSISKRGRGLKGLFHR